MKKLRVLTLMREDLVPPDDWQQSLKKKLAIWKTECDVVTGLKKLGHDVEKLGAASDLGKIRNAIQNHKPHVVFNLLEEFHGEALYDQHVASYLELLRQPYTGCNPRGLTLSHDKALSKKIFLYHKILTPRFSVFPIGRKFKKPAGFNYPLFVKSSIEDASWGISQASLVSSDQKLKTRIEFIHDVVGTDAITEEYIDGRELYVSLLGNHHLQPFPIWELQFTKLPEGNVSIATTKAKWETGYQKQVGLKVGKAKQLSLQIKKQILHVCRQAYRILGLTGYARMDLRLSRDQKIYLIEANANPDLDSDAEFASSAKEAGLTYPKLLQRIISVGLNYSQRWQ